MLSAGIAEPVEKDFVKGERGGHRVKWDSNVETPTVTMFELINPKEGHRIWKELHTRVWNSQLFLEEFTRTHACLGEAFANGTHRRSNDPF